MTDKPAADGRPGGGVRRFLGLAVALAVSAVCLYFFLRGTNWADVWSSIRSARPLWVLASFASIWVTIVIRAVRWRVLLLGLKPVSVSLLYHMSILGFALNGVLPARAGEVIRTLLVASRERLSFAGVLASVVMERVLDLAMVILMLVVSLRVFDFSESQTIVLPGASEPVAVEAVLRQAGSYLLVFFGVIMAVVVALVVVPDRVVKAVADWSERSLGRVGKLVAGWLVSFRDGLKVLRNPSQASQSLVLSVVVWLGIIMSAWLLFPAFSLEIGFMGACLLAAGLAISVAVPQAPGYLGVFQLAVTLILVKCFGVDESVAKAYAIVLWGIQLVGLVGLGFVSLVMQGVAFGELRTMADGGRPASEGD